MVKLPPYRFSHMKYYCGISEDNYHKANILKYVHCETVILPSCEMRLILLILYRWILAYVIPPWLILPLLIHTFT